MSLYRLINPVMPYAWGSRDAIAELQGRPQAPGPEAELWMGAHPHAPSMLEGADRSLASLVAEQPREALGARVAAAFGGRLPFLLKVIAAAAPLSLQVHPDDEQARAGFARESASGLATDDPRRCYRDPNAKPEMVLALSDFDALLGFRAASEAADALSKLHLPQLDRVLATLRGGAPPGEAFLELVSWPDDERAELVRGVRAAASSDQELVWVVELADRYPVDPGVVGALLLNRLRLAPGQACYVAPGQIHAYLCGTAVEILGNSDNVVRGGLTPKHVAVEELRRLLRVDAAPPAIVEARPISDAEQRWPSPRPEFQLSRVTIVGRHIAFRSDGPEIWLCVEGRVEVDSGDDAVPAVSLASGDAIFVGANARELRFVGQGVTVRATTADPTSPMGFVA